MFFDTSFYRQVLPDVSDIDFDTSLHDHLTCKVDYHVRFLHLAKHSLSSSFCIMQI